VARVASEAPSGCDHLPECRAAHSTALSGVPYMLVYIQLAVSCLYSTYSCWLRSNDIASDRRGHVVFCEVL
jgi:hypothetical protein